MFSTTVISEPDDVTICEGRQAVFTCVLNTTIKYINSSDVQWYRFIKDTSNTEMVDQDGTDIHYVTHHSGNTLTSQLTITNTVKSHAGYYWIRTPSSNICNASLTVTTSMYICICTWIYVIYHTGKWDIFTGANFAKHWLRNCLIRKFY